MQTQHINIYDQMCFCSEKKQDQLTDFTINNNLPIPNFNSNLGAGMYGEVWDCEDGIHTFKVTRSKYEAKIMNYLADNPAPGLADVIKVVQFKSNDFVIWKKKVDIVGTDMFDILKSKPNTAKYLRFIHHVNEMAYEYTADEKIDFIRKWDNLPLVADFVQSVINLINEGIYLFDFHGGNFGINKAGTQVTAFDFSYKGAVSGKIEKV